MEKLFDVLAHHAALSEKTKTALSQIIVRRQFRKGTILLRRGQVCQKLYLIESGFLRGYCVQHDKEKTLWFAAENEVVTSMYSFSTQQPSHEVIEVMATSILYCISYEQLLTLYNTHPELNLVGRLLTEKYCLELEVRTQSLQLHSAEERYRHLEDRQPALLQKASLGQIASYLGISQETLSRIRSKKR